VLTASGNETIDSAPESGHDRFAIQAIVFAEMILTSVGAINAGVAAPRIDDPNEANAGVQPVPDLAQDLARSVVSRQHLDHEVGSHFRETAWRRDGESLPPNECDVCSPDCIRIPPEYETRLRRQNATERARLDEVEKRGKEARGNLAMTKARRLAHHELAMHELRPFVQELQSQQLIRRHRHGRRTLRTRSTLHAEQRTARRKLTDRPASGVFLAVPLLASMRIIAQKDRATRSTSGLLAD
jgi:hypothetical protein